LLDLDFGDAEHATAALWRLGPDVEVLAPPELRNAIARKAAALAAQYRGTPGG
jgi:predicted DNA-binding transcriptional regulator YafY